MAGLSTTSYAVLALLGVRPWTPYELAKQMRRSLRDMWPRAESVIYEEPKRLVARGLARSTRSYTGRRASTVYSITDDGRRALAEWLDEPGRGPVLEFEGLLKVAFADHGSVGQLRALLAGMRADADDRLAYVTGRIGEYERTGGPFPERLPVISLVTRFYLDQARMVRRWTAWAEREVASWPEGSPAAAGEHGERRDAGEQRGGQQEPGGG